jgi:biofilm protein TabA
MKPQIIKDSLTNFRAYSREATLLAKAFDFLVNQYRPGMKDGRFEIDGEDCYAMVQTYTTVNSREKPFESHELYIDLQYVAAGTETIEHNPIETLTIAEDKRPGSDVILYKKAKGTEIVMNSGDFALFYPRDGHKPGLIHGSAMEVKKVVVKIRIQKENSKIPGAAVRSLAEGRDLQLPSSSESLLSS